MRRRGPRLVGLGVAALLSVSCARPEYDVVLLGGRIVDGTGKPGYVGDLGVRDGRIVRIAAAGALAQASARRRVVADRLVVAPGFIDILSHSRRPALNGDSRLVSKLTQGVTTEIMGEGISGAPANDRSGNDARAEFRGQGGFGRWLEAMETRGVSANVGSFVGGATLRRYAMGGARRAPTSAELDTMRSLVRDAMRDGAFGLATALVYDPGRYASAEELTELAREVGREGGIYATHLRSEGDALLEAIDEALAIGRAAGVPVEILHFKVAGERNWPKLEAALAKIDSAGAQGQDVTADMYPYAAARTSLLHCLPPWASADGRLFDNLADSATRTRIHAEMLDQRAPWESLCRLASPGGVILSGFQSAALAPFDGRRLSEAAAREGTDWAAAVIDWTLRERRAPQGTFFVASEDALDELMRRRWMKFGTDAAGVSGEAGRARAHPRAFGTYPRVLGRFVRERRTLGLEQAVHKMTGAVAARLSIPDRGVLREGAYADLVVFDPEAVADRATYAAPDQLSIGIRHVFVNGVEVVTDGRHTGAKPGRVVRGPGYRDVTRVSERTRRPG